MQSKFATDPLAHPNPGGWGVVLMVHTNQAGKPTGRVGWSLRNPQGGSSGSSDSGSSLKSALIKALKNSPLQRIGLQLGVAVAKWDPQAENWVRQREWMTMSSDLTDFRGNPMRNASTRPENTLWDVAQLGASKPTETDQPFSGSHVNQRLANFEPWLNATTRELGLTWESPDGERFLFKEGPRQLAELTKVGSRWQLQYDAGTGSRKLLMLSSLNQVKNWLGAVAWAEEDTRSAAIRLASTTKNPALRAALLKELTAGSGATNARYLASISAQRKAEILKAVAKHYGVSVSKIESELTDPDAENLYEYLAFNRPMAMQVYRDQASG